MNDLPDAAFERALRHAVALADAPPAALRAAIDLWPAVPPSQAAAHTVLRRIAAVLSFDSWSLAPLASDVRALRSETRQLLFSAEGRDFDLRITPAADRFAVTGQVLGPDESGLVEWAKQADGGDSATGARIVPLDDLGEFRLESVNPGTYLLTLRVGADEIVLPPIVVGQPQR